MNVACACMGPINGEPHCPCAMKQMGLRTDKDYDWPEEKKAEFAAALAEMYGWNTGRANEP